MTSFKPFDVKQAELRSFVRLQSGLVTESINEITDVSETFKVFARVSLQGSAQIVDSSVRAGLVTDV